MIMLMFFRFYYVDFELISEVNDVNFVATQVFFLIEDFSFPSFHIIALSFLDHLQWLLSVLELAIVRFWQHYILLSNVIF